MFWVCFAGTKNICAKYLYFICIFFINQPVSRPPHPPPPAQQTQQYLSMLYNNPYCFTKSKSISLTLAHLWLKLNIVSSPPRTPPPFIVEVIAQIFMDKAVNRKNIGIPLLQKDVGILLTKPKPLFLDFYQIQTILNSSSSLTKVKNPVLPTTGTISFYC